MKWFQNLAIGVALTICVCSQAWGTTILPMDLNDLTGLSGSVVYGRVVEKEMAWNEAETMIETRYVLDVGASLKEKQARFITITAPGGRVDDLATRVAGIPEFHNGEELILFLEVGTKTLFPVVGWENGVFRVVTAKDKSGQSVLTHDWMPVTGVESGVLSIAADKAASCMTLQDFLAEVDGIAARQAVEGFKWRFAHLFNGEEVADDSATGSKVGPMVTGKSAVPVGIPEESTQSVEQ